MKESDRIEIKETGTYKANGRYKFKTGELDLNIELVENEPVVYDDVFNVYVNGCYAGTAYNEDEAWEIIDEWPIGSIHAVYDDENNLRDEFIPY